MGESIQTCAQGIRNLQTRTRFRGTTIPETEELPVEKDKYNTRRKKNTVPTGFKKRKGPTLASFGLMVGSQNRHI